MSFWGFLDSPVSTSYLNTRTLGLLTQDTMLRVIYVLGNLELKILMLTKCILYPLSHLPNAKQGFDTVI